MLEDYITLGKFSMKPQKCWKWFHMKLIILEHFYIKQLLYCKMEMHLLTCILRIHLWIKPLYNIWLWYGTMIQYDDNQVGKFTFYSIPLHKFPSLLSLLICIFFFQSSRKLISLTRKLNKDLYPFMIWWILRIFIIPNILFGLKSLLLQN